MYNKPFLQGLYEVRVRDHQMIICLSASYMTQKIVVHPRIWSPAKEKSETYPKDQHPLSKAMSQLLVAKTQIKKYSNEINLVY